MGEKGTWECEVAVCIQVRELANIFFSRLTANRGF